MNFSISSESRVEILFSFDVTCEYVFCAYDCPESRNEITTGWQPGAEPAGTRGKGAGQTHWAAVAPVVAQARKFCLHRILTCWLVRLLHAWERAGTKTCWSWSMGSLQRWWSVVVVGLNMKILFFGDKMPITFTKIGRHVAVHISGTGVKIL